MRDEQGVGGGGSGRRGAGWLAGVALLLGLSAGCGRPFNDLPDGGGVVPGTDGAVPVAGDGGPVVTADGGAATGGLGPLQVVAMVGEPGVQIPGYGTLDSVQGPLSVAAAGPDAFVAGFVITTGGGDHPAGTYGAVRFLDGTGRPSGDAVVLASDPGDGAVLEGPLVAGGPDEVGVFYRGQLHRFTPGGQSLGLPVAVGGLPPDAFARTLLPTPAGTYSLLLAYLSTAATAVIDRPQLYTFSTDGRPMGSVHDVGGGAGGLVRAGTVALGTGRDGAPLLAMSWEDLDPSCTDAGTPVAFDVSFARFGLDGTVRPGDPQIIHTWKRDPCTIQSTGAFVVVSEDLTFGALHDYYGGTSLVRIGADGARQLWMTGEEADSAWLGSVDGRRLGVMTSRGAWQTTNPLPVELAVRWADTGGTDAAGTDAVVTPALTINSDFAARGTYLSDVALASGPAALGALWLEADQTGAGSLYFRIASPE
jgi:hypothetical protein